MAYIVDAERKKLPLRYRNLNDVEKNYLCNGCGPKAKIVNVPNYLFTASCDHHDFNYWIGYREEDREEADKQFYEAMKYDASLAPWYRRWWLYGAAWRYYTAVRWFGSTCFSYGEKERGWEDLEKAMTEYLER